MSFASEELRLRGRGEIYKVFDRISRRYDLANTLISFGQDARWRRALVSGVIRELNGKGDFVILDLGTGTGEVIRVFREYVGDSGLLVGIDMSENMLNVAKRKCGGCLGENVFFLMDAMYIGLVGSAVDAVTIAFGIRNVAEVDRCLEEIWRVLKPGGVLGILEFGLPQGSMWRNIYMVYLNYVLPGIGKVLTGEIRAYRYLGETICSFPSHEKFLELLFRMGFVGCTYKEFLGGAVLLYLAHKPKN
ncbi:MAG: ubiquinone/menaquinone biosynthesis methyltransferase [Candidatus Hydrogenedentes bacterium]|nr:ubiquinone/menaquinone biosynthesis methyltransferase [Candidatus Hydrogenedentota bacterium]